jgi:hypothetical protein
MSTILFIPFFHDFFGPFGLFDFTFARALWMTLLEICLVLVSLISLNLTGWKLKPFGIMFVLQFSLLCWSGLRTLILGQFSGVNAVLVLGSLLFIKNKRDLEAGVLFSLSLLKPQMSILIVIFTIHWALSTGHKLLVGVIGFCVFFLISTSSFFQVGYDNGLAR